MRAVICKELGPPESLVVEELPDPTPGKGEVVIDVRASGVNFPDTLLIQGKYQFKPSGAFSPGGEVAGVIEAVGEGVEGLKVGDHVIAAFPFGGWRDKVVVSPAQVIPIPASVPFDVAASFYQAYGTSHYALKDRADLKPGETLCVLGAAGGVGLAAVEIGKVMGARVIACASSDEKLALCKEHGADEVINYATEDLKSRLKALTGGNGADVVYDPVGGDYSEQALRATAWYGRFLVVGFAAGPIPSIPLNLVLLKSCQICGVFWGSFAMRDRERNLAHVAELMEWLEAGKLKPHVWKRYRYEEAAEALRAMMERRIQGKVVLVP
ncbi:MAG: NADPH:quinone oxidoreductase family protein [Polyangiaceae bacterium]